MRWETTGKNSKKQRANLTYTKGAGRGVWAIAEKPRIMGGRWKGWKPQKNLRTDSTGKRRELILLTKDWRRGGEGKFLRK